MGAVAPDLSVKVGSLILQNPVMPASGTFGYGEEYAGQFDLNSLGALVSKAVSPSPRPGNPPPRMVELEGALLNSIGLQNPGVEGFCREKGPFLEGLKVPVLINVVGNNVAEYSTVVRELTDKPFVAGFEINLSCPNVSEGLRFGTTPEGVTEITAALRQLTPKPLWMKLSPNVADPAPLAQAAEAAGADAIVAINTLGGMAIDLERRRPVLGARFGGVSGPAVKAVALKVVWRLAELVSLPVIGVGGIMTGEDALEFILAGATAVQVGTANFVDPTAMPRVVSEISAWMSEHGEENLVALRGTAHQT